MLHFVLAFLLVAMAETCPVNGPCPAKTPDTAVASKPVLAPPVVPQTATPVPPAKPAAPLPQTPTDLILELSAQLKTVQLAMDAATEAVAKDQAALVKDLATQAKARTARDKIAADLKAAIDQLTPGPDPTPNPVPPKPNPVPPPDPAKISLLMLGRSTGCPACDQMTPVLTQLASDSVSRVDVDKDAAAQAKYQPLVAPTWIMLSGDKEISRATGIMTAEQIRVWLKRTKDYVKK